MLALGEHKGIIFDLDGTLVDSKLDFDQLCQQLGWPLGTPILEHLATFPLNSAEYQRALQIIHEFELAGARNANWLPGAQELLTVLSEKQIPIAILTRNMREATLLCIEQLAIPIEMVITREDCQPKPDPSGLWHIAKAWQMPSHELLFIGDYLFDLQTAHNAGMPGCLYMNEHNQHFQEMADFVLTDFAHLTELYRKA